MKITQEMVDYVAVLSRLKISDQEKLQVQNDLGSIIDYIDLLNNVDTTGVEPMSHAFAIKNVFRKDEIMPSFDREALLCNAPKRDEESFIVPKTVE